MVVTLNVLKRNQRKTMNAITAPNQLQAIARHFQGAVVRAERWASVGFAVIRGVGARFFSLKVLQEAKMQIKMIASNGGYIAQILGEHTEYKYARRFISQRLPGATRRYAEIVANLQPGVVYEFRGVFLSPHSKKPTNGFFEVDGQKLVDVREQDALKYCASAKRVGRVPYLDGDESADENIGRMS